MCYSLFFFCAHLFKPFHQAKTPWFWFHLWGRVWKRGCWSLLFLLTLFFTAAVFCAGSEYHILINLPALRLYLYEGQELVADFPITVGHRDTPTPTGHFHIVTKLKNPIWWPPDGGAPIYPGDENPLGTRWLGLNRMGYGIHGNNNPGLIGQTISRGCIRMYNEDVEVLFSLVQRGASVEIVYKMVELVEGPRGAVGFYHNRDIYQWGLDLFTAIEDLLVKEDLLHKIYLPALTEMVLHQEGFQQLPLVVEIVVGGIEEEVTGFRWGEEIWIPTWVLEEDMVKHLEKKKILHELERVPFVEVLSLVDAPYVFFFEEELETLYVEKSSSSYAVIMQYNDFKK